MTRDRSMPEVITNMKLHQCLAAPKIGKFLGFGINQKYKFWIKSFNFYILSNNHHYSSV